MTTVSRFGSPALDSVGVQTPGTSSSCEGSQIVVCAADPTLMELARWNLDRQGYRVLSFVRDPCRGSPPPLEGTEGAVVVDLDDGRVPCLTLAAGIRRSAPSTLLVLLSFDELHPRGLDFLKPYVFLQKPFAMRDFNRLLDSVCGKA